MQEEIQNMFKVEKTKILSLIKNENILNSNKKKERISADFSEIEKNLKKKELWINNL